MEGSEIKKNNQTELVDIVESILVNINILEKEKARIPFNEAITKLNSLKYENIRDDSRHFIFLVKNIFLDKNGSFDFEKDKLRQYIKSEKGIKDIFNSLLECVESKKFLDFLLELGGLISNIYFDKGFNNIIEEFEHKGINSYEFLFQIFAKCKKSKENKFICDNYDIYFSQTYMIEISYDLILAMNLYIKACISSPKFDNLSGILVEDINPNDSKEKKEENIKIIEKHILRCLQIFWTNSYFFLNIDSDDFMNYFYDFITLRRSRHFILENPIDDNMRMYLEHMSFSLENLFKDFNDNTIKEFELSLFEFVKKHQNENIEFVERALSIKRYYPKLKEEDIGLISMICSNNKYIEEMKILAKGKDINELNSFIDENKDLLGFDAFILSQIVIENTELKDEDKKLKPNDELTNNNNLIISESETNEEISEKEIDLEKMDFSDNLSNKKIICQLSKKIGILEKEAAENRKIISDITKKITANEKKNEETISELNKRIEILSEILRKIYFRDVSKYYINEFARINNIDGNNTYDKCQNILNSDFSKLKDKNMQEIISKIIVHYLNGNKFAHMEYFITKSKALKKEILAKEVENSYMLFMKFKEKEKTLLCKRIKIINAPFVYYHRFK